MLIDCLRDKDIETLPRYSNYLSDDFFKFSHQIVLRNLDKLTVICKHSDILC